MNIQWIVAPLMCGVIGYITNWLAIKMLFRPFRPVYIGKWRLPFTPGLIPKEKARLAQSMGDAIAQNLLEPQTVRQALLSEAMREKIASGVDQLIEALRQDERTLQEALEAAGGESVGAQKDALQSGVAAFLTSRLLQMNLGNLAAGAVLDQMKKKSPSLLRGLVGGMLDERIGQGISHQLEEGVNKYLAENAQSLLSAAVDAEAHKLMDMRICALIERFEYALPALKQRLLSGYERLIHSGAERALQAVDIAQIVRERVEGYSEREMEQMILDVMARELNAIVSLGALLGFIMGFANLLFA